MDVFLFFLMGSISGPVLVLSIREPILNFFEESDWKRGVFKNYHHRAFSAPRKLHLEASQLTVRKYEEA